LSLNPILQGITFSLMDFNDQFGRADILRVQHFHPDSTRRKVHAFSLGVTLRNKSRVTHPFAIPIFDNQSSIRGEPRRFNWQKVMTTLRSLRKCQSCWCHSRIFASGSDIAAANQLRRNRPQSHRNVGLVPFDP
jgi:hypothetical protein